MEIAWNFLQKSVKVNVPKEVIGLTFRRRVHIGYDGNRRGILGCLLGAHLTGQATYKNSVTIQSLDQSSDRRVALGVDKAPTNIHVLLREGEGLSD